MTEEEIINVEFKDETTGEVVGTKQIKNDIFIDATKKYNPIRKMYVNWLNKRIQKLINRLNENLEHRTRFKRVHKYVKQWIIHRGLKICDMIIGKHMIHSVEDIPAEPHNNHQRIWLDSWFKSIDDMWGELIWKQGTINTNPKVREDFMKLYPTKEVYIKDTHKRNRASHKGRTLMGQLYITEVMEDTADRTMLDSFCMRLTHSMMEFYCISPEERKKVPSVGEYPVYLSNTEKNKPFFISFSQIPTWFPLDSKETKIRDLEMENQRLKMELNGSGIKVMKGNTVPIMEEK